ncbi:MAG: hypothetical protein KKA73_18440 [Chloroflexi bacterium]|nr:hypothetical protein [Chloroflexota bacterium]MBU1749667.1 hypothetical protein [Chloroflexota bacterium]
MSSNDWPYGPPPRTLPLLWLRWHWSHASGSELAAAVVALAVLLGTLIFMLLRTNWGYTLSQVQGAAWSFLAPPPAAIIQPVALPSLPTAAPQVYMPAATPTPWIIERVQVQQVEVHHYYYQGAAGWTESAAPPVRPAPAQPAAASTPVYRPVTAAAATDQAGVPGRLVGDILGIKVYEVPITPGRSLDPAVDTIDLDLFGLRIGHYGQ